MEWLPAYDDGGSPIKNYELWYDEVAALGQSNSDNWQNAFTGADLTYTVSGLVPKTEYRFKVRAFSEYSKSLDKYSMFSPIT